MKRGKEFKGGEEGDEEKKEERTERQLPPQPLGLLALAGRGCSYVLRWVIRNPELLEVEKNGSFQ